MKNPAQLANAVNPIRTSLAYGSLRRGLLLLLFGFTCALLPTTQAIDPGGNESDSNCLGGRIVFQSNRDGNFEIYSMKADGTEVTRLTNNSATDRGPAWSHDGRKIAFVSDRDGTGDHIYVMNANGTHVVRHTSGQLDENPAWSPDDTEIAYESLIGSDFEIVIMNADGSGKHAITHNHQIDIQPDWSPDGTKILFNHNYEIAVMNRDGTGGMLLTHLGGFNEWPHYSPEGTKIVFHSTQSGNYQIYVMRADGQTFGGSPMTLPLTPGPFGRPSGTASHSRATATEILRFTVWMRTATTFCG